MPIPLLPEGRGQRRRLASLAVATTPLPIWRGLRSRRCGAVAWLSQLRPSAMEDSRACGRRRFWTRGCGIACVRSAARRPVGVFQARGEVIADGQAVMRAGFDDGVVDGGFDAGRSSGFGEQRGGAFARIVDVGFVGGAENREFSAGAELARRDHALKEVRGLAVVDFCGRSARERPCCGKRFGEEPGIDRDAVAADARPRLQYLHARMQTRELDRAPRVDAGVFGDAGEDVRQSAMLTSR